MNSRIHRKTKQLVLSLVALTVLAAAHTTARADEVFIAGFTAACFGAACAPAGSATLGSLTYTNSTFLGTTADGFRGIGANANPSANFNNLGSFTLNSILPQAYNSPFTLLVTFTAPQGLAFTNQAKYSAVISGELRSDNVGGVFIDFNNTAWMFFFNDRNCEPDPTGGQPGQQTTCGIGSFSFSVNDLAIDPGSIVPLTGQITAAQQRETIPEPATLLLLGTGLTGIAARWRRRRKTKIEATKTAL